MKNVAARILALALLMLAGAGAPAAADPPKAIDGIRCDTMEGSVFHIHAHLTILAKGKPVQIPPDVGLPIGAGCLFWVHTHTPDGLIHIEAPTYRDFTLGEFFDVWGEPLSRTNVANARVPKGSTLRVWVNGVPYKGDPRKITLNQHTDIVVEAGAPYSKPALFTDWKGQ